MENIKRILVVSRDTKYCRTAVHYGFALSRKFGAKLYVLHVMEDSIGLEGFSVGEYEKNILKTRKALTATIAAENDKGLNVKELVKEGKPATEIFQVVKEEQIDLIILLAHEEGHLEHFFFGRSNDEIIRKMPCSILMVKKEPSHAETQD
jgi:universal stress protein A